MKIGDRVAWIGAINFGRHVARWTGTVLSMNCGVPSGYDDQGREIFPRFPAALVHHDVPQHDMREHYPGAIPEIVIALTKLELVESCSDKRSQMIASFVTTHERKAIVCECRTCRSQSQARCGCCNFLKAVNLMRPASFGASEGWRWLCAACDELMNKEKTT